VIDLIAESPEIIMREICEAMEIPKSTLTSLIDRLEKRGCLHRVISPRDRRSYGLELTPLGHQIYEEHLRLEEALWTKILGTLDDDAEREEYIEIIRKIVAGVCLKQ
jgi:DNA-binding MarR family transcriptional regulator